MLWQERVLTTPEACRQCIRFDKWHLTSEKLDGCLKHKYDWRNISNHTLAKLPQSISFTVQFTLSAFKHMATWSFTPFFDLQVLLLKPAHASTHTKIKRISSLRISVSKHVSRPVFLLKGHWPPCRAAGTMVEVAGQWRRKRGYLSHTCSAENGIRNSSIPF